MRVLIIDDEFMIATDTATVLEDAGCVIVGIAGSVAKALEILDDSGCDAVVLDANLNGASAEPVAAALRERDIPYLVVSGYRTDQRAEGLAGAPFLRKPYRVSELVAAVLALGRGPQKGPESQA